MVRKFDSSKVQTPGDESDDADTIRGADQGAGDPDDPAAIAEARERQLAGTAMAEAAARGETADIAPPSVKTKGKLKPGKHKRVMPNGDVVEVDINARPIDPMVEMYGPEVQAPKGTPVRKDGTPCQGNEQPFGVVGDIMTSHGRLVSRVIPYDSLQDKDAA